MAQSSTTATELWVFAVDYRSRDDGRFKFGLMRGNEP